MEAYGSLILRILSRLFGGLSKDNLILHLYVSFLLWNNQNGLKAGKKASTSPKPQILKILVSCREIEMLNPREKIVAKWRDDSTTIKTNDDFTNLQTV